jgi:hypothetical protein
MFLGNFWQILTLNSEPFAALKQAKDGFWRAIQFFMIVGLIAGLGKWAALPAITDQSFLPKRLLQNAAQMTGLEDSLLLPVALYLLDASDIMERIEAKMAALEPPLGKIPSRIIRLVGNWLVTPFELLTPWFGFMLALWVVAKLLGGQGTLPQHLTLLTLAAAPQVLRLVDYLPYTYGTPLGILGQLLTWVALAWSVVIAVKALAIAHEMETRRAVVSVGGLLVFIYGVLPLVAVIISTLQSA